MADKFRIRILADGRLKVTTDRISAANHLSADRLLRGLEQDLGGDVQVEEKRQGLLFEQESGRERELE